MAFDLQSAIKKMGDVDKDFRITATTDLTEELRKDAFTMDAASESKVVESILRLLADSAKEVQDVAVKALGPLVKKVSEQHVTAIINKLAENIALTKRGTEELREVSNSGLKTVLRDVEDKLGERVSNLLIPGLIAAIKGSPADKKEGADVVQECLDVTNDLLARFGSSSSQAQLQSILDVTLPHLDASRNLIKQRAIWVLTNVAKYCSEQAFALLCTSLIQRLGGDKKKQSAALQLIGSVARNVGFRMGKHVNEFVPLLTSAVLKSSKDGDEETKENAFQAFGSFVESCPRDVQAHIDGIVDLCLKFVSWDPNQLEDSGDGSAGEGSGGDDDDGDGDSGMEASEDEDDATFRVRKAAAKTLTSVVVNHQERLELLVAKAALPLVRQFRERESFTRHEILGAYEALARTVAQLGKTHPVLKAFQATAPEAIRELAKLLANKNVDTRITAIGVLASLGRWLPGSLGPQLGELLPGIAAAIGDASTPLRVSALDLTRQVLAGSTEQAPVQPHLDKLFAPVEKLLRTAGIHSRVATAALDASEAFLVAGAGKVDFLNRVYKSIESLFKQTDLDSEAKEAAVRAGARAICNLGTKLPSLQEALGVIVERLGSELSRETAAIAVATIAESGTDLGSDAWLGKAVPLLCSFCQPGARTLKVAALTALGAVLEGHGDRVTSHSQILEDVAQLVDVEDLLLAQLAILVVTHALRNDQKSVVEKCIVSIKKSVYPKVLTLLASPLLEGISLLALADFYGELGRLDVKNFGYAELIRDLEQITKGATDGHVFRSVGACYAQILVHSPDPKRAAATVADLVRRIGSKAEPERLGAVYALAEVGKSKDISEYGQVVPALAGALDSESRSLALAASYAIGRCAIGNLVTYLPFILNDMKQNPRRQLLLLQAVKEIVSGSGGAATGAAAMRISLSSSMAGSAVQDIAVHLDTLLPILFVHAGSEDDLTRNAVAECLGRLSRIAPDRIVAQIAQKAADPTSAWARATAVNALRYAVSEKPNAELDAVLSGAFAAAANAVGDKDVHVRLAGLQALTWALQLKPRIVKQHVSQAMPTVYRECKKDESLIKVIDLGQIKHITDYGLDKRQEAYNVLYVLLETAFEVVAVGDYVQPIVEAMEDEVTIKEAAFKIVKRLAQVAGGQLYALLDKLVPLLEKEIKRPIPKSEPGPERLLVMKRAAMEGAIALTQIPNASSHVKLQEMFTKSVVGGIYKDIYTELTGKTAAAAPAPAAAVPEKKK